MKKKGSSLIFTLCVVAMLTTLTLILVSEASVAYTATSNNEKKDKTSLMAESGVQMGINKLKDMLSSQDSASLVKGNGAISGFTFNDNGEKTDVSFVNNYNCDGKNTIKITSTSTLKEKTRTINAYISKDDISNPYYDFLKDNVLTVLDKKDSGNISFDTIMAQTPLEANGQMYFQGSKIRYIPMPVALNPVDKIKVNADTLAISLGNRTLGQVVNDTLNKFIVNSDINTYTCDGLDFLNLDKFDKNLNFYNELKKFTTTPKEYDMLGVSSSAMTGLDNSINLDGIINLGTKTVRDSDGNERLVLFVKCKGLCVLPLEESVIEKALFDKLVLDYLLQHPLQVIEAFDYAAKAVTNMYKVYIVDGDVQINAIKEAIVLDILPILNFQPPIIKVFNKFKNFIIYSTGQVNFGAPIGIDRHDEIGFFNSSIMANRVKINDLNGIGIWFDGTLNSNYKQIYESTIKNVFEDQLINYGDEFSFKIYKWEEK